MRSPRMSVQKKAVLDANKELMEGEKQILQKWIKRNKF